VSALPRLPPEIRANSRRSSAEQEVRPCSSRSMSSAGRGANRYIWQRDRMVGSRSFGRLVISIRIEVSGFLQSLQDGIGRLIFELLGFVNNEDSTPAFERFEENLAAEAAHLVNLDELTVGRHVPDVRMGVL